MKKRTLWIGLVLVLGLAVMGVGITYVTRLAAEPVDLVYDLGPVARNDALRAAGWAMQDMTNKERIQYVLTELPGLAEYAVQTLDMRGLVDAKDVVRLIVYYGSDDHARGGDANGIMTPGKYADQLVLQAMLTNGGSMTRLAACMNDVETNTAGLQVLMTIVPDVTESTRLAAVDTSSRGIRG